MSTALILIHGRSQQMARGLRRDQTRVNLYVDSKKQAWLAGLAKGVKLAGQAALPDKHVYFPFYGNLFADLIDQHVRRGGRTPDLETLEAAQDSVVEARDELLLDAAAQLGFRPDRELSYLSPELAEQVSTEAVWDNVLRLSVLRSALQFLSRKTGVPGWIIEEFLSDVAYYLEDAEMRAAVLRVVTDDVERAREQHDDVVVVGHSLGSVVAYDLLQGHGVGSVRLFVTAGSPLGYPIVQRNLVGAGRGTPPAVPRIQPRDSGPHWINAYDPRDFVALVHPLRDHFADGSTKLRDEITHNPSDAHAVEDYLADPDVAGPIARALQR